MRILARTNENASFERILLCVEGNQDASLIHWNKTGQKFLDDGFVIVTTVYADIDDLTILILEKNNVTVDF